MIKKYVNLEYTEELYEKLVLEKMKLNSTFRDIIINALELYFKKQNKGE